jgi:hypothetical protein
MNRYPTFIHGLYTAIAALAIPPSASQAGEPAATASVFVIGSPPEAVVIGDTQHCRTGLAPANRLAVDRVEYRVKVGEPFSISVSDKRHGQLCGGSFYILPEIGLGYAVRLTLDKQYCAAQLFRLDPRAQVHALLLRSDTHPQLDELICASQRGTIGSSRLSLGGRFSDMDVSDVKAEIGDNGFCGKFDAINAKQPSGVELSSNTEHWIRLHFSGRSVLTALNQTRISCDLQFAFAAVSATSYFIDYSADFGQCDAKLLRIERTGEVRPQPVESAPSEPCSASPKPPALANPTPQ